MLSRRAFCAGTLLLPSSALALGEASEVDIAEIMLASGTTSNPGAWEGLLFGLMQTTSVEAVPRAVQVAPDDPALFVHPIAVLSGSGSLPELSSRALEQLARYLSYGGFLLINDESGTSESAFDASVRSLVRQLLPNRRLEVLRAEHSVYRSFFLLDAPAGRVAIHRFLEGVPSGSMHPLLYSQDDLVGALKRRPDGTWEQSCSPGEERQRREAVKTAINILMYALTSNYKQDQAHVRELMRANRLPSTLDP
jgi:hypothetical protein